MKLTFLVDNNTCSDLTPEWGLSVYIQYGEQTLLLDTGASDTFAKNAEMLGLPLEQVEFGVLSHAHYDHSDGMETFFEKNSTAPFYLRAGCGENCYHGDTYIGIRRGMLERFKNRILFAEGAVSPLPGVTLLPHSTSGLSAIGEKAGMYVLEGNQRRWDSFDHEQSLVLETAEGLVVMNSCSHGGALNILREVGEAFPGKHICALIGGLHLYDSPDETVEELASALKEAGVDRIYTGHCTGDRAMELLQKALGDRVVQIYTGMELEFA